jgi:hypothetical protein
VSKRDDMRAHIFALCAKQGIVIRWCRRPTEALAIREFEEIDIAPIRSEISYAVALHEIGHIVGRHQLSRNSMVRERWAWRWAQRNALTWTPTMERVRRKSLAFARDHAGAQ